MKAATFRAFRKKAGLSQSALAVKATEILRAKNPDDPTAGVSESLVALIETGRRQPSYENAEAFCEAMDIPVDALVDDRREMKVTGRQHGDVFPIDEAA